MADEGRESFRILKELVGETGGMNQDDSSSSYWLTWEEQGQRTTPPS